MSAKESMSIEELETQIYELGAAKADAQVLLEEKLIRRGITNEGTIIDPPRIYPLRVIETVHIGDAIYLEGEIVEPHPLEALALLRDYAQYFEDVTDEY